MKLWTVADARARFSTLLNAARNDGPQVIRQSGLPDVRVERDTRWVPMSYLANALARCDGMGIALAQYRQREDGGGHELVAEMHLPPNLSGDVLAWVLEEKGEFEAASYVISAVKSMRALQSILGLPLSSAAQVVTGLRVTAGVGHAFTTASIRWIEQLARDRWGEDAPNVLGPDWDESAKKATWHESED